MLDTYPTSQTFKERGYDPSSIPQWSYSVQELVDRINTSFGDIPRPTITPHVARAYDDEYTVSMDRGLELTKLDPEQHWRDVTDHNIENFREYFCFSDDEGWRFYMPAYLLHALRRLPNSHDFPVYDACKDLSCVSLLSDSQLSCLVDFAKLCEACRLEEGYEYYF
jgi:hypothetical protein